MDNTPSNDIANTNVVESSQKEESPLISDLAVETIPNEFNVEEFSTSDFSTSCQPLVSEMENPGYLPVEGLFYEGVDYPCQYAPLWYAPQFFTSNGEQSSDPSQQYRYQNEYPSGFFSPYYDPTMQGYIQNPYLFDYQGYFQTMGPHFQPQYNYERSDCSSQASSSTEVPSYHTGVATTWPQSEGFRPQYLV